MDDFKFKTLVLRLLVAIVATQQGIADHDKVLLLFGEVMDYCAEHAGTLEG